MHTVILLLDWQKQFLVINPEISTPFVNFKRRDIHFIFGDGCVASVISKKNSSSDNCFKIIDRKLITQIFK
jgi:beta-ketodecanoyl-[acyl-carrier-protein] synthase